MANNTTEIFIEDWKIVEFTRNALFAYVYGFAGIVLLFGSLNLNFVFYVGLPFVFVIAMIFRNKLIKWLFRRGTPQEYYLLIRKIGKVRVFAFILLVVTFAFTLIYGESLSGQASSLLMGAVMFFIPLTFLFVDTLTDYGEIRVLFQMLYPKIKNFSDRQELLHKIFEKLEKQLKKGQILISHDKIIYYFNTNLTEPEKAKSILEELEEWMTGNENQDFLSKLKQIVPESEIKPFEKDPKLKIISPYLPEIIKYSFILAIVLVTTLLNPTLISDIIKIFLN